MSEPKFPEIEVQLAAADGNGWALHGAIRSKLPADVQAEFTKEALTGHDYDHLLATAMKWVNVS